MDLPENNNSFGLRLESEGFFIGKLPVSIVDNVLSIDGDDIVLTEGLKELLLKSHPVKYTTEDLLNYKHILSVSNAHKQNFDESKQKLSSSSWKYCNIISKLFPSKRKQTKRSRSPAKMQPEDDRISGSRIITPEVRKVLAELCRGREKFETKQHLEEGSEDEDTEDEDTEDFKEIAGDTDEKICRGTKEYIYYSDVNELVERFKKLETEHDEKNKNEIWVILRELERLGVIEFYK